MLLCSHGVSARKTSSHGALIHDVRKTQRLAVPVAAAPPTLYSLRLRPCLRPTSSFLLSTRSSRLPRCRGRALARLPPAPQLRGPRSTISPRSRPGKLVELDAFCVPSSSPRGRCHSPETRCTFQTSGSVIAAGCRRLPQHGQRRRHRGRVQRRDREDLGERGDLRAARVEQGQERLEWAAGLLRAAATANVITYNAWIRVLAEQRSASRFRSMQNRIFNYERSQILYSRRALLDFVVRFVLFT